MTHLREIWFQVTSKYTTDQLLVQKLWAEIESQYTSKNRYYHTLEHIESMVTLALKYQDSISDLDTLLFSIFYHDIIYKSRRKDNEEKSAQLAQIRLHQLKVPSFKAAKCAAQIMATKHHDGHGHSDTTFFLDLDLAILGASPERYRAYSLQIRKEYVKLPNLIYRYGRRKVLRYFLDKKYIYQTKDFRDNFETQARLNLKNELEGFQ